jgi:exonuclease VII large subunit
MSEEQQTQEPAAIEGGNTEALQRSVEALERKNQELIAELRAAKKSKAPDGVNVEELLEFKRNYEQQQLESQGKYQEARQALEQQFREATAQKDQRIAELETRVRELELLTPAVSALADIVHDPDLVMKTKLSPDRIEREPDGTVVVVDGYQRTPVQEWAKTLPAWMQKQPKPQGSGAPTGGASSSVPAGMTNPFNRDTFNLTEQARLYKTDRDLYERMKANANR